MLLPIQEEIVVVREGYLKLQEMFDKVCGTDVFSEEDEEVADFIFEMGCESIEVISRYIEENLDKEDGCSDGNDDKYEGSAIEDDDRIKRRFFCYEFDEGYEDYDEERIKKDSGSDLFWRIEDYYPYCEYGDREWDVSARRYKGKSNNFLVDRVLRLERMCAFFKKNNENLRSYVNKKRMQVSGEWEKVSFEGMARSKEAEERNAEIALLRSRLETGENSEGKTTEKDFRAQVRKLQDELNVKSRILEDTQKQLSEAEGNSLFFKIILGTFVFIAILTTYF